MGAPGTTEGLWKASRCGALAPNDWNVISDLPTDDSQFQRIRTIDRVLSYCGAEEAAANAHQIAASGRMYDALEALCAGSIDVSGTAIVLGSDAWTKLAAGMHALEQARGEQS